MSLFTRSRPRRVAHDADPRPSISIELRTRAQLTLAAAQIKQGAHKMRCRSSRRQSPSPSERNGTSSWPSSLTGWAASTTYFYAGRTPRSVVRPGPGALSVERLADSGTQGRISATAPISTRCRPADRGISATNPRSRRRNKSSICPRSAASTRAGVVATGDRPVWRGTLLRAERPAHLETLRDVRMAGQLRLNMATCCCSRRVAEADRLFSEGAEHLRRLGDHELLPHLVTGMANPAGASGRRAASELIEEAIDLSTHCSDQWQRWPSTGWRTDRPHARPAESAHRHVERALEWPSPSIAPTCAPASPYDLPARRSRRGHASGAAFSAGV